VSWEVGWRRKRRQKIGRVKEGLEMEQEKEAVL